MNEPAPDIPPMPVNFGPRYVLWAIFALLWNNILTALSLAQAVIAALLLMNDAIPHSVFKDLVIGNAVLMALIAQLKKRTHPLVTPPTAKESP